MTRKILSFIMLMFAALPVNAQELSESIINTTSKPHDTYCIPAEKLRQLRTRANDMATSRSANILTVNAYQKLFDVLIAKNSSGTSANNAGCITQQELAAICQSVWYNDIKMCESFIYDIVDEFYYDDLNMLTISENVALNDFNNIDADIFDKTVNAAIDRRANKDIPSKLQDTGPVFLKYAEYYRINPFMSVAIAMEETGRGTSSAARLKNNIGGLGTEENGWLKYPSVEASIQRQAEILRKNVSENLDTLQRLTDSGKYCLTGNEDWGIHVRQILREIYLRYNDILRTKQQSIRNSNTAL